MFNDRNTLVNQGYRIELTKQELLEQSKRERENRLLVKL